MRAARRPSPLSEDTRLSDPAIGGHAEAAMSEAAMQRPAGLSPGGAEGDEQRQDVVVAGVGQAAVGTLPITQQSSLVAGRDPLGQPVIEADRPLGRPAAVD